MHPVTRVFFLLFVFLPLWANAQPSSQEDSQAPQEISPLPADTENVLDQRRLLETRTAANPFAMTPHKTNYLLPLTWNSSPNSAFAEEGTDVEKTEVHFQLSLKAPVLRNFWDGRGNLVFAYTNRSWWQAYNKNASSPFRETNHEPELLLSYALEKNFGALRLSHLVLGLNHQSNGQSGLKSRSWNRILLSSVWSLGDRLVFSLRPWYRIPESRKKTPDDPDGDDNPDIHQFMGYGDLRLVYKLRDEQTLSLMVRNNLRGDHNRGAIQVDWTFPFHEHLKLYMQYFNGYGESLLDYDASVNRIGVGILLTDWL